MNDLERHVIELIGEDPDSPDVFVDTAAGMTQIRESLNDAIEEICMVTGSMKRTYIVPLEASQMFYRLSFSQDEFGWVTDAFYHATKRRLEQTDLVRLNAWNPRWMQLNGSPQSYLPTGFNVIGFIPKPAAAEIVELTCVVIPGRYSSDADRIKLRDEFKWAAVHFAVGEYYASRGDAQQAMYHHNNYLDRLGIQQIYPLDQGEIRQFRTNKEYWPRPTG